MLKIMYCIRLLLSVSVLATAACSSYYHNHEQVSQQKTCLAHCEARCAHCQNVCDDNETICQTKINAVAAVHFDQYRREQKLKGQPAMAELNAFRDPLACQKASCDCEKDKTMCKQACYGTIHKLLRPMMQLK